MPIFLIASAVYIVALVMIRPAPESLKAPLPSYRENFLAVRGSLFFGLLLLVVFLFSSSFTFLKSNQIIYEKWALHHFSDAELFSWPQIFTHLFIHIDLPHVVSNVLLLGLLSLYERRVGTGRFFKVLAVASFASIFSIFFYDQSVAVSGISGGVFGIGAAWFVDHEGHTWKEWVLSAIAAVLIVGLFSIQGELQAIRENDTLGYQVDHAGHAIGFFAGMIFCFIDKQKKITG